MTACILCPSVVILLEVFNILSMMHFLLQAIILYYYLRSRDDNYTCHDVHSYQLTMLCA